MADGEEDGVCMGGTVDNASLSDSTLVLAPCSSAPFVIFEGERGDGGVEGMDSSGRAARRLIVILLEVGSGRSCSVVSRVGVRGGGAGLEGELSSFGGIELGRISKAEVGV